MATERKDVYVITEREGQEKAWWTKIGVAFVNKDQSLTVFLDAMPVNGKLHIRDPKPKDESDGESEPPAKDKGKRKGK